MLGAKSSATQKRKKAIEDDEPDRKRHVQSITRKETLLEKSMGIFQTFPKQREAIDEMKKSQVIWRDDLRIFSYEIDGGSGERRYIVTTIERFIKWYLERQQRHIYELIYEEMPCRLYFDLEYSKQHNHGVVHQTVFNHFTSTLALVLQEMYDINLDIDRDLLILESSTDTKFSAHIICHFENDILFPSSMSIRNLSNRLHEKLLQSPPYDLFNADGKKISLFDSAVYSRNRNFRIYLSSKLGKPAKLDLAPYCRFYEIRGCKKPSEEKILIDSLCVPSQYHKYPVLDERYFNINEENTLGVARNTARMLNDNRSGQGPSPLPHVDDFIKLVLQKWTPDVFIRAWKVFEREKKIISITYYPGNNRYCFNIDREHKSNGTFWTVDVEKRNFYQKCFDPDCRGVSSNFFPLPAFVNTTANISDADDESQLDHSIVEQQKFFTNWEDVFDS